LSIWEAGLLMAFGASFSPCGRFRRDGLRRSGAVDRSVNAAPGLSN